METVTVNALQQSCAPVLSKLKEPPVSGVPLTIVTFLSQEAAAVPTNSTSSIIACVLDVFHTILR